MDPEERYPSKSRASRAPRVVLLVVVVVAALVALFIYDRRTSVSTIPAAPPTDNLPSSTQTGSAQ